MPPLVQIIACRLFDTRPLSEPMLPYCQSGPRKHISVKCCLKFKSFIQENALENVCEIAAILFRPQCVKGRVPVDSLAPVTVRSWPSMIHKSIIQCGAVITRPILHQLSSQHTPYSLREVWGVCFVFQVWFMFSCCYFSAVFNIMLKWTTL